MDQSARLTLVCTDRGQHEQTEIAVFHWTPVGLQAGEIWAGDDDQLELRLDARSASTRSTRDGERNTQVVRADVEVSISQSGRRSFALRCRRCRRAPRLTEADIVALRDIPPHLRDISLIRR